MTVAAKSVSWFGRAGALARAIAGRGPNVQAPTGGEWVLQGLGSPDRSGPDALGVPWGSRVPAQGCRYPLYR